MSARSKIEWTDASWNPVRARRIFEPAGGIGKVGHHCEHISEGCRNCYAETFNRRLGTGLDYKPGHRLGDEPNIEIFLDEKSLLQPLHWRRPRKIFVGSMTDLFADFVTDAMLDRIFAVMARCSQHTFQVLTKRAERMLEFISSQGRDAAIALDMQDITGSTSGDDGLKYPLRNVWLGVSCEDQATADERIPPLLATPAAIRFLSCEPLLGPIDLEEVAEGFALCGRTLWRLPEDKPDIHPQINDDDTLGTIVRKLGGYITPVHGAIDWVICGGESGPNARPMHPDWARSLRDQCSASGTSFFFKQWGEWLPGPQARHLGNHELSKCKVVDTPCETEGIGCFSFRVGKSRAGRLLDGVEHNEFPVSP